MAPPAETISDSKACIKKDASIAYRNRNNNDLTSRSNYFA
ncbi:MAG: hypothetical protein JWP06_887 [Candidatus Saccharibacteria bacterium]|nr:hypothetical protein [Candidatus Saccharibacteria bacterium]